MPELGGAGCGVATALVLWINVLLLGIYTSFTRRQQFASTRFFYGFASPNRQQIKKLLKLGVPIGVAIFFEASLFSLGALVISPLGRVSNSLTPSSAVRHLSVVHDTHLSCDGTNYHDIQSFW